MHRILLRSRVPKLFLASLFAGCLYILFVIVRLRTAGPVTSKGEELSEILTNSLVEVNVSLEGVKYLLQYYHARRFQYQGKQLYTDNLSMTGLAERYKDRKNHLRNLCSMLSMTTVNRMSVDVDVESNIWIQQEYGLALCTVAKVGSTFWRRVLKLLDWNNPKIKSPFVLVYDDNVIPLSMNDILVKNETLTLNSVMHTFKSVMYVREPYGRLFSAYIDKLFSPNALFFNTIGMFVIKNFRENPSNLSLSCGHDVKFSEIVKYFIFKETNRTKRDIHFIPIHEQCDPCRVNYEIIAKMETFQEDTFHILHSIGALNRSVHFYNFRAEYEIDAIIDQIGLVFRMKQVLINCLSFHQILQRLWRKFIILGILDKTHKYPLSEYESGNVTMSQFTALVVGSHRSSASSRRRNKMEAFAQAYSQVCKKNLYKLQKVLMKDLLLFGYDVSPKSIFQPDENIKPTDYFDYFDII